MATNPGIEPVVSVELAPCRACGSACRVEHFPPNAHRDNCSLWLCSQHQMFGGQCPSDTAYLFEDAWNARPSQPPVTDVERVEKVARAIRKVATGIPEEGLYPLESWREQARAAIEAMGQ